VSVVQEAVTNLRCDAPECEWEFLGTVGESPQQVRVVAGRAGWTRNGQEDHCPTHGDKTWRER